MRNMSKHRSSASHSFKLVGQRSNLKIEEPANSQQHYHSPKYFNAISAPELIDNSRNKATMADELNAGIENGNLSDKDIIIAYVYLLKRSSSFSKIHIPFQVGWPNRLWEEFCRFFSFFFSFDCLYNTRPQVR